MNITRWWE